MREGQVKAVIKSMIANGDAARDYLDHTSSQDYWNLDSQVTPNYSTELIQIAAVIINMLADLWMQESGKSSQDEDVLDTLLETIVELVLQERQRQDDKFGQQPTYRDPMVWLAIVAEELGGVAEEVGQA